MTDLFQLVFEYRILLAQRRAAGLQLSSPARQRLDALHRLLRREPSERAPSETADELGRRRHARCETHARAVWRVDASLQGVDVVDLGAGGVGILSEEPLEIGQLGVLSLKGVEDRSLYKLSARVSWVRREGDVYQAGLRFVGAPLPALLAS